MARGIQEERSRGTGPWTSRGLVYESSYTASASARLRVLA
jgi:hypothetical protein